MYPNGVKAQLDFILINKKWVNSAHNCEAYNSFEGVSSDHRIVSGKFQLSLRANVNKSLRKPPNDWKQLSCDVEIRDQFTITLRNRYDLLQEEENNTDPNRSYENFVNAYKQADEKCIPLKPKRKLRVP